MNSFLDRNFCNFSRGNCLYVLLYDEADGKISYEIEIPFIIESSTKLFQFHSSFKFEFRYEG